MKGGGKNGKTQKKLCEIKDKEFLSLLVGRKGGKTTMKILDKLFERPYNANQLCNILNVDYNTIIFHVKILVEHEYVEKIQVGKTIIIHASDKLIKNYDEYLIIKEIIANE